jgi:hypothetical protein
MFAIPLRLGILYPLHCDLANSGHCAADATWNTLGGWLFFYDNLLELYVKTLESSLLRSSDNFYLACDSFDGGSLFTKHGSLLSICANFMLDYDISHDLLPLL